jgi:hypothetical protein
MRKEEIMSESIEIGDLVSVDFCASGSIFRATVLYCPQATGDSWILKQSSGQIVYVQMFERMDLDEKSKP